MTREPNDLPRLLVADDSSSVRRMVQQMFEDARYSVVCASSGEQAFELALGQPFDAIVTDLTMESLSGVQLCRILNGDPATRGIPVVMLTATDTPYSRFCARHAGADAYVTKADARSTLVSTVDGLVDRSALRESPPTGTRGVTVDPVRALSRVLEEHLFLTLISSEIRGFVSHDDGRRSLGEAVLGLCAEVLEHRYAVLELLGPTGRSLMVHANAPWPDDDAEGLRALGVDVTDASIDGMAHSHQGAVVPGATVTFPIETGHESLGSLTIVGAPGGITDRTRTLSAHIARELGVVTRSLVLVERMREMAETDPLTGLANRRRCVERLEHELARARRSQRPLCLMLCDIDHFKAVNDTHGHNAGDEVLREVARELVARVREVDLVGRWGGEEFILALPDATIEGGLIVAERLRRAVAELSFEGPVDSITISAGLVECEPDVPLETLVHRADECLYEAKARGRDRVVPRAPDGGGSS